MFLYIIEDHNSLSLYYIFICILLIYIFITFIVILAIFIVILSKFVEYYIKIFNLINSELLKLYLACTLSILKFLLYNYQEIIRFTFYLILSIKLCSAIFSIFCFNEFMIDFLINYTMLENFNNIDLMDNHVLSNSIYYMSSNPTSFLDVVLNRSPSPGGGGPRPPESNNNPVHDNSNQDNEDDKDSSDKVNTKYDKANSKYDENKPWSSQNTRSEVFRPSSPPPTLEEVRARGSNVLSSSVQAGKRASNVKLTSLSKAEIEVLKDAYYNGPQKDLLSQSQKNLLANGKYSKVNLEGLLKSVYGIENV